MRGLGAAAVLATGADHLYEYAGDGFSSVPTIGTLFLLNFIGATIIGVGLLLPLRRLLPALLRPYAGVAGDLLALSGLGLAATALISLWISETSSLFGFSDAGLRPPILAAIVAEAVAILALGGYLLLEYVQPGTPFSPLRVRARTYIRELLAVRNSPGRG
jgi:hypothetical protein